MPAHDYPPRVVTGFSIVELCVVLAIAAILGSIAIPWAYHNLQQRYSRLLKQQLINAVQYARSQAMANGSVITICGSSDQRHCDGNWSTAWLVFKDSNSNANIDRDDKLLRLIPAKHATGDLGWNGFGSKQALQFNHLGLSRTAGGSFNYRLSAQHIDWKLTVNRAGRLKI